MVQFALQDRSNLDGNLDEAREIGINGRQVRSIRTLKIALMGLPADSSFRVEILEFDFQVVPFIQEVPAILSISNDWTLVAAPGANGTGDWR